MERSKEELDRLIDRYLLGECTAEETQVINSYFNHIAKEQQDKGAAKDIALRKQRTWKRMNLTPSSASLKPIFRYVAAAVVLLVSGWALFSVYQQSSSPHLAKIQPGKTDIQPGGFGATLTLADGRRINLDSDKSGITIGQAITYEDGSTVLPEKETPVPGASFLTASTVKGQTYTFTLPDGTKVWLNADSKLTFPSQFVGGKRKVVLEGEGYFVVNHEADNSFFVESHGQVVEDLGTEFNIQAYANESVKTTLVDGAIKVNKMLIKPGEQTTLLPSGTIKVEDADIFKVLAWKQGDFVFRGERLEEVLQVIARWYDIEVKYEREASKGITVGGTVSRSKTIRSVLDMMEQTEKVRFNVTGRTVTVL